MSLPRTSGCRCRSWQRRELLGHCENHAESRFTRHHASIRFFGFFQRKRFDHGANVSEDAEIKSVLGLDRSSRQASNDRAATKDERNSVDRNWITRNSNYHELSANGEARKQAGDCGSAGGGRQDDVGTSQLLQCCSHILGLGVDVKVRSQLGREMFFVWTEADSNGAEAHLFGVLHAEMPQTADTLDSNGVASTSGVAERIECGDAGADQRGRLF